MIKVLEFKHHAPFDGCFWRWEYIAVDEERWVDPIIFTDSHGNVARVIQTEHDPIWAFTDYTWFDWPEGPDDPLMRELPYGHFPAFWKFAEENDLDFPWQCADCGQAIGMYEPPIEMAGYRGNGGIGIEVVGGWLCSACVPEEEYE